MTRLARAALAAWVALALSAVAAWAQDTGGQQYLDPLAPSPGRPAPHATPPRASAPPASAVGAAIGLRLRAEA